MKLVLMAGGQGVRLRPLTYNIPKPMVPINGKPMLEYNIEWAKKNGVTEIMICSGYLSKVIENYFGDGSKFGVKISYSVEKEALGTGGALSLIKDFVGDEDFILLYADILCKVDFNNLMRFHKNNNADCTLVVQPSSHPEEADLIELEGNKVVKFWNRPHVGKLPENLANSGLHVLNGKLLDLIPQKKYSLENDFLVLLVRDYKICGYQTSEFMEDMGRMERIKEIEKRFKEEGWDKF